mmetsp:Transcript_45898/g.82054  ORF Transcript_45898/g.82054 Transcript_45898/m.82054 type:complete len:233 (+) Transcript_45898:923-1621(+)
MGRTANRPWNMPTVAPVYPAKAACTAAWASWMQRALSPELAGTLRMEYEGSNRNTFPSEPVAFQWSSMVCFIHLPTSPYTLCPVASLPWMGMWSWPADSAMRMTAFWLAFRWSVSHCSSPSGPSSWNGISGIRQAFTTLLDKAALRHTNPASRPMSFTSPTPFTTLLASVKAQSMYLAASMTAVSNPKVLSKKGISLSMVLGMPMTAQRVPLASHRLLIFNAARWDPSPPMT